MPTTKLIGTSEDDFGDRACRRRHSLPVIMHTKMPAKLEVVIERPLPPPSPSRPQPQLQPPLSPNNRESILVPGKIQPLHVNVNRPAIDQSGFDTNHDYQPKTTAGCCRDIKDFIEYEFSRERLVRGLKARFPCIEWMRNYDVKENMLGDIISGITVGIMQIPLGMAYAILAGCPPQTGLYTSFFAVIIYCLLGTSKHVSQGTFAVISLMFSKTVLMYSTPASVVRTVAINATKLSNVTELVSDIGNVSLVAVSTTAVHEASYTPIQVASAIAMMVGIFQILFGFIRLGVLNVYMSDTLVSGFTTGAAVLVFTSQFNSFFEIKVPQYSWPFEIIYSYIYVFSNIHSANVPTIVVSIVTITVLVIVAEFVNPPFQKKFKVPIPIELMVVVVGTGLSYALEFKKDYKIAIVGFIPSGIPAPTAPPIIPLAKNILGDAIAVAIVSYVIQLSLAKIFAKKHNYEINANQEFIASGVANVCSSFLSCFPMSVALSRSMVHDSVGGKTQMAGLISCGVVLIVLLAVAPLFQTLPNCVLAAIIVVAIRRMFLQFRDVKKAWNISKLEAATWVVTFLSVCLINIDIGLGIGVFFSIMTVIWSSQSPHTSLLGLIPESGLYKDIKRYPTAIEVPGIKIYQFAAPIIFANAKTFRKELYSQTGVNPRILLRKLLKQRQRSMAAIKKRPKRRGSLIKPNPSNESLDSFYTKINPLDERQLCNGNDNGNIILDIDDKGMFNNAFELDKQDESEREQQQEKQQQQQQPPQTALERMNGNLARKTGNLQPMTNRFRQKSELNGNCNGLNSAEQNDDKMGNGFALPTVDDDENKLAFMRNLPHYIILDLSCSGFIDTSGVQVLQQVIEEYKKIDIAIYFATCPVPVIDMLESSNFFEFVQGDILFPTIHDAILYAQHRRSNASISTDICAG